MTLSIVRAVSANCAEVCGAFHGRGRGGAGAARVAVVGQHVAQAHETGHLQDFVVHSPAVGDQTAEFCDSFGKVPLPHVC